MGSKVSAVNFLHGGSSSGIQVSVSSLERDFCFYAGELIYKFISTQDPLVSYYLFLQLQSHADYAW